MNEERSQLSLVLNDIPFNRDNTVDFNFSLPEIGGVVMAMHGRGVIHGSIFPSFVSRRGLKLSPYTRFIFPTAEVEEIHYYQMSERNEDFDIFCLGILALLQGYGLEFRRYETTGFPSHFYNSEGEFIHSEEGKEIAPYWRCCLHRHGEKRPSFWTIVKPPIENLLLYPLPSLPLNSLFSNDFLLSFKSFLTFDIARKYPRDLVSRMNEGEFRNRIDHIANNLLLPLATQTVNEIALPIFHHETLPLHHMLRDNELFHKGLHLLSRRVALANISDAYLLEFFISYTRYQQSL